MDAKKLEEMAVFAFGNVKVRREKLFVNAENTIEAQSIVDVAKATALASGKVDGKNEETRKAQLTEIAKAELSDLKIHEGLERAARYQHDLALVDVDTVKTLLRIAELSEGMLQVRRAA